MLGNYFFIAMQPVLIVQKGKTTQKYDERTRRIPVTQLTVSNLSLADIKTQDKDGYDALKLTSGIAKRIDKPTLGSLKKSGITTIPRLVKEVRMNATFNDRMEVVTVDGKLQLKAGENTMTIGSQISPSLIFKIGDIVDVTGVSKGKGFQGVVKRHNFRGGPKTHGQSDRWRSPGSIGSGTTPGRINKGKRMAGRMGGENITVQGIQVISISENGLEVKGLVPGIVGSSLVIKLSKKSPLLT